MDPAALLARLSRGVLVLDGGLGSLLIDMGLEAGRAPEWWNLEHPQRVSSVHRSYVQAGSQLIHANSFGGSAPKLRSVGLEGRVVEVNLAAARLARAAAGEGVLVAGDLGPTGRMFPPMGDATEAELEHTFAEQAAALCDGGADLLSIETMYDLREARAAVRGALRTGLAVIASMTFERKKRGVFTIVGDRLVGALQALQAEGAQAVGFNCSVTSDEMVGFVREASGEVDAPLVAQANAGQPRATPEGVLYDADPRRFAADVAEMVRAGARLVGGCCGTDPGFIRAMSEALGGTGSSG